MNSQFYQSASYVSPGGIKAEERRRQEQWDGYQRQQQAQTVSMSENNTPTTSRKRADSHQPSPCIQPTFSQYRSSSDYNERPRRFSSTDYGYSNPYGEVGRLSGNFNAPTDIELEREREHRKSLTSVEKLRSKVKRLVKA